MSYHTYDEDPPMIHTLSHTRPKAKKEHRCQVCREVIPPGTCYNKFVYLDDDLKFQMAKYHIRCDYD